MITMKEEVFPIWSIKYPAYNKAKEMESQNYGITESQKSWNHEIMETLS